MQFEVVAEDGRTVQVDSADWMMALVRGVDLLGARVSGFSCTTAADGVVTVEDHGSGRTWLVKPIDRGTPARSRPTPMPAEITKGPTPDRLMQPRRRHWRAEAPRPLWAPDAMPRETTDSADPGAGRPSDLGDMLYRQAAAIREATSVEQAMDLTLDRVLALVPAEGGSVLRGGRDDDALTFLAVRGGAGEALLGQTVPWGVGIAGACCVGGVPLVVRDVASDPRHYDEMDRQTGFSTAGILAVPVRTEGGFYGVVELVNPTDPAGFQNWHIDVVESLARALADRLSGRR